jgi:DNA-binding transcriptional ArsR family regulator
MSTAKLELFDQELQDAASFYKALSHPARLAILNYLAESKICITGDISKVLPLSRTTVNQHLDELKRAGLIKGEISGVKTKYCLNKEKLTEMSERFKEFIINLKCC